MEFKFYDDRFFIFLNTLGQPENIIQILFSYLGHFGVQIFIFLSAYGLTKKYQNNILTFWPYLFRRFSVVYPSFFIAILFWAIVTSKFQYGLISPLKVIYWNIESIILKITLLSNFIETEKLSLSGPWWFIPFIFQFYFLFPVLLKILLRWKGIGLFVISVFSIIFTSIVSGEIAGINLYFTIIGHLPEFCLGMYLANSDSKGLRISKVIIFISIVLYFLGNIYESFWYINHISFLVILLVIFNKLVLKIKSNNILIKTFMFLGTISMPLFLVNGFLRNPFLHWAIDAEHWFFTIIMCLISLGISIVVAIILLWIERYLMSLIGHLKSISKRN